METLFDFSQELKDTYSSDEINKIKFCLKLLQQAISVGKTRNENVNDEYNEILFSVLVEKLPEVNIDNLSKDVSIHMEKMSNDFNSKKSTYNQFYDEQLVLLKKSHEKIPNSDISYYIAKKWVERSN